MAIKKKSILVLLVLIVAVVAIVVLIQNQTNQEPKIAEGNDKGKSKDEQVIDEPGSKPSELTKDSIIDMVNNMTLDEKIGQLILAGFDGMSITEEAKELINKYKVGGFILFAHNLEEPTHSVKLLNDIKLENQKNDIPLFLGVDQEGGRVTRLPGLSGLPTNAKIGATNDTDYAFQYGELLGEQLQSFGFQFNFAPVLDVNSNPHNQVIGDRSYGSDPELVSKMGVATIKGMESTGVIPAIKHFPGHGDTSVDSHKSMPVVDKTLEELEAVELIPFKAAIDAGVDVVMTSHIALPKLGAKNPATMSEKIITSLLRGDLGFDGVVITDDLTMGALSDYGVAESANEAIKAGVDIVLVAFGHDQIIETINRLKQSVESGEITEARIDESVIRILRLKEKFDLVDDVNEVVDIEELQGKINEFN